MVDLINLAERCEAAEGADREWDAEICIAAGAYRPDWREVLPGHTLGYFIAWSDCAPAYTASIDAAMQLVPEGARVILDCEPTPLRSACVLGFAPDGDEWHTGAATPALALCAAALRARASS